MTVVYGTKVLHTMYVIENKPNKVVGHHHPRDYTKGMAIRSIINHPKDGNSPVSFRMKRSVKTEFVKKFPKRGQRSLIMNQLVEQFLRGEIVWKSNKIQTTI